MRARWSTTPYDIARPSDAEVPRPTSSSTAWNDQRVGDLQTDQRSRGRFREDASRLQHLNHERRARAVDIITRSDTRVDGVHEADAGVRGRYEAASLGQEHDERRLSQERALSAPDESADGQRAHAHVRTRDDVHSCRGIVHDRRIGHVGSGGVEQGDLDANMTAVADVQVATASSAPSPLRVAHELSRTGRTCCISRARRAKPSETSRSSSACAARRRAGISSMTCHVSGALYTCGLPASRFGAEQAALERQ